MKRWGKRNRMNAMWSLSPRIQRRWIVLALLIIVPLFIFAFIDQQIREPFMQLAKLRVKQIAMDAMNESITMQIDRIESEPLVQFQRNAAGNITDYVVHPAAQLRLRTELIAAMKQHLHQVGRIVESVPLGQLWGSTLLTAFGPQIPIEFEPHGAVQVAYETRTRTAGINMVVVELYMRVDTDLTIIVPFDRKPVHVRTEVPVNYMLIVGDVPTYYYNSSGEPIGPNAYEAPFLSTPLKNGNGSNDQSTSP